MKKVKQRKTIIIWFTYLWNIRNSREIIRRRKGKMKGWGNGGMNHERLWTLGNKLRVLEERGVGDQDRPVMGIKEVTCCMVHWVLYASNESWNITSKTKDVLYGD